MARPDADPALRAWTSVPVRPGAPPAPPAPLAPWCCTRGHKLAYLALAPGSTVRIYCRECKSWYDKEVVHASDPDAHGSE